MSVELGHFALVIALALSLVQSIVPVIGARRNDAQLMDVAAPTAIAAFGMVALSSLMLVQAYVTSDFSVLNVIENSHSQKPLIYKITGTWGNHEGSMLLWVLILTFFSALVAFFSSNLPSSLRSNVLAVQGWIATMFLAFILFTSNPFVRVMPAPFEGQDLNPLLQDIGLAIHPPLLYLGYVGFSVCFSFAVAALIEGRLDAAWARWVRPWALTAWLFLTGGIAMGSYWAYYELGWGGWWFWDPVENASFMPWLVGTALLHSALVMEKRNALKIWTVLLALLTFSLSLLGTFLVRSGVLTSVHSFATDPGRGLFILAILGIFIGGSLALFALRVHSLTAGGLFQPISREGSLVFNNLFLTTATATVLIGTLYPLLLESLTGDKISVGEPFFNMTFGPLMIPLLMAIPFGPLLAWKRGDLFAAAQRLMFAFAVSLIVIALVIWMTTGQSVLAAFGIGLAAWVMVGSLTDLYQKAGFGRVPGKVAFMRLKGLPGSIFGTALAHFGVGVTLLGIIVVTTFGSERVLTMKQGDITNVASYSIRFEGLQDVQGSNFNETQGHFTILADGNKELGIVSPGKRFYPARQMPTTESGIMTRGFDQIYLALGDESGDGEIVVRIWWKPMVTLIWLGALLMMIGGVVSLSDRRLRVGAPVKHKKALKPIASEA